MFGGSMGIVYELSPTGQCKPWDASADATLETGIGKTAGAAPTSSGIRIAVKTKARSGDIAREANYRWPG